MTNAIEAARETLRTEVNAASAVLGGFPRMSNGLTPDSVKSSPEYIAAKLRYARAFEALRHFNTVYKPQRSERRIARNNIVRGA